MTRKQEVTPDEAAKDALKAIERIISQGSSGAYISTASLVNLRDILRHYVAQSNKEKDR